MLEAGALFGKAAGVSRRHHAEAPVPISYPTDERQDCRRLPDIKDNGWAFRFCSISADRSLRSSHDPRSDLRAASEHIQQHGKTIAQTGLGRKAKLFGRAPRVPDRDPHFAAARWPTMRHELGSTQFRHGLGEITNGGRFTGADIEYQSLSGRHSHRLAQRTDCIPDIGEITGLFAVAENLDRFSTEQPLGKNRDHAGIRGKWILARSVKVKKPQADRRDTVYGAGDTFYEAPGSVHLVSANASTAHRATFVVFVLCEGDQPVSVPLSKP